MIGNRQSPGPGIAVFEGNSLIINDSTKPHMTDDPKFTSSPKVKIEYLSATDMHKMTVYLQGKELAAEFKAR